MTADSVVPGADRVPPHSIEAETGVLGSMILDRELVGRAAEILDKDSFYKTAHQLLFDALVCLYDSNRPIDSVILREELAQRGHLAEVGGFQFLGELMSAVPDAAHGMHYAQIVRDKAIARNLIQVATQILKDSYEETEVSDKLLDKAEHLIFEIAQKKVGSEMVRISDILKLTMEQIESWADVEGRVTGISTGFIDIDNMTSGLQPAQLIIVAGRPSMGKTSFALNVAEHVAVQQKRPLAIFSMETSKQQIVQNLLCMHTRIDAHRMRNGTLRKEQYSRLSIACGALSEAPIIIDDSPGLTPLELRAKARRLKSKENIQLLIVDYVQLMNVPRIGKRQENRQQEIAEISRSLKGLARELSVPVVAVAQLSRAVEAREGHRPRMSDLRESGALEQDADVIMLLYREEYYKSQDEAVKGKAEVIIAKQRNGPTGTVPLAFISQHMKFADLARQPDEGVRSSGYQRPAEATAPF
jgi:replicative DNA helicase